MAGKRKKDDLDYEFYEEQAKLGYLDRDHFKFGPNPNSDDLILPDEQAEMDMLKGHMEDLSYQKT
jgi:hypothetical protein